METDYFGDLIKKASQGLGFGTGAEAASTIGKVGRDLLGKNGSTGDAIVAAGAPLEPSSTEEKIFGMDRKTAIYVGAGVVVLLTVAYAVGRK